MTATLDRPPVLGRTEPRLWTRPLRPLRPDTTLGYQVIAFAENVLGVRLLPWQRWWLLHALELRPDGTFRFSTVLTLVARQNGKTVLLKIVALWALYMGHARLVLGAAQALNIARESWTGAVQLAESVPELAAEVATVRHANGEQCLTLVNGARYMITAATRGAGRGLSVDLLILDELREQRSTEAWAALGNTTMARPNALTVGISNQGDDQSVVLNTLRASALADADPRLALFEWSAPDGCELDDVEALAQANPGLGHGTVTIEKLGTMRASTSPTDFRTENLCQRVDVLDAALDADGWAASADPGATLASVREQVAVCIDVAPDGQHVTLIGGAQLGDGRYRIAPAGAWSSTESAREDLPSLLERIKPYAVGWFPRGPGSVLGPDLAPYDPVKIDGGEVPACCQSLADLVTARKVRHPADPLINAQVAGAQRLPSGDGWRFVRRGAGHVDAVYATAGVVHILRTVEPPVATSRPAIF